MTVDIIVEPMTEQHLLWRCLHSGPVSLDATSEIPSDSSLPLARYRDRNLPLLKKLTKRYGACAIIAHTKEEIVGQLRFYPKSIVGMGGARAMCLQQDYPYGPADDLADSDLPDLPEIEDKTLYVHCLMTGSSLKQEKPYQRKGIGTRMVKKLIEWAETKGWEHIEADSFEDLPVIYEITGSAGRTFWEKIGFHIADRHPHPDLQGHDDFVEMLEKQAKEIGISAERAKDRIVMRLDLT